jgi:hypothetical protein
VVELWESWRRLGGRLIIVDHASDPHDRLA